MQDLVTHDRRGLGRVIAVEETAVLADFRIAQRRISTPYARMTIVTFASANSPARSPRWSQSGWMLPGAIGFTSTSGR